MRTVSGRPYSRRETIKLLAAVPAISATVRPKASQGNATSVRKGRVRLGGPLPRPGGAGSQPDPVEQARAARALGYGAMNCPPVDVADKERLRAIEAASKAEDVVIAEVGAFGYNMMARDPEERKKALDVMCDKLMIADEVGARVKTRSSCPSRSRTSMKADRGRASWIGRRSCAAWRRCRTSRRS